MARTDSRPRRRRAVAGLLEQPRYEVMPLSNVFDEVECLPRGAVVTVTSSPHKGADATIDLAVRLAEHGVRPVPHLAARQVRDRAELAGFLHRLEAAGIDNVFVVGGDAREPAGEFDDGLALLEAMDSIGHPFDHIGIPSYPDGHHAIDDDRLWAALQAKQRYATYTVTQMCFDAATISRFTLALRRHGITLPIYAGIPGVVDMAKLLRVSLRIGVGDSLRFARGNKAASRRLLTPRGYRPDALVRKLGAHVQDGKAELAGLHIYTFNHVDATVRWMQTARRKVAS
ncbi:methylenetetrahydrofolate reductase [Haloechinothrix sp. YIM 98757]|uniref:Methylenetetrahydrofolate reductase n=1 Tax=Haloechinothrix aidingensis TaxID=2752311 RepID=A0A838A8H1_9PSEU|nr:methylenetetrahydrofolate reductase [Haloechinothrix aidingensis]MBA0125047.1 methylenetetrahydrofolate reductase [Haloechinothrix aidingensis]